MVPCTTFHSDQNRKAKPPLNANSKKAFLGRMNKSSPNEFHILRSYFLRSYYLGVGKKPSWGDPERLFTKGSTQVRMQDKSSALKRNWGLLGEDGAETRWQVLKSAGRGPGHPCRRGSEGSHPVGLSTGKAVLPTRLWPREKRVRESIPRQNPGKKQSPGECSLRECIVRNITPFLLKVLFLGMLLEHEPMKIYN